MAYNSYPYSPPISQIFPSPLFTLATLLFFTIPLAWNKSSPNLRVIDLFSSSRFQLNFFFFSVSERFSLIPIAKVIFYLTLLSFLQGTSHFWKLSSLLMYLFIICLPGICKLRGSLDLLYPHSLEQCLTPGASQVALVVKNLAANAGDRRDADWIPGSERSPGGGNGNPLQYSCLENTHGERTLAGYATIGLQRVGHD